MGFESDFGIVSGILCKDMGLNVEDNRIGKCLCECYKLSLVNEN